MNDIRFNTTQQNYTLKAKKQRMGFGAVKVDDFKKFENFLTGPRGTAAGHAVSHFNEKEGLLFGKTETDLIMNNKIPTATDLEQINTEDMSIRTILQDVGSIPGKLINIWKK